MPPKRSAAAARWILALAVAGARAEMLLPALDHAAKAATKGGCAVGVCTEDAVLLGAAPQASAPPGRS